MKRGGDGDAPGYCAAHAGCMAHWRVRPTESEGLSMAATAPRLPEQFRGNSHDDDFTVSELVSDAAGAHSPFGDIEFPVPHTTLPYHHPSPAERPHLAGGH